MESSQIAFRFYSKELGINMVEKIVDVLSRSNEGLKIDLSNYVNLKGYHKIENLYGWIKTKFIEDGDDALIAIYHVINNKSIVELLCFDDYNFSLGAHLYTVLLIPKKCNTNAMVSLFTDACTILEAFTAWAEPPQLRESIGEQIIAYEKKPLPSFGLPYVLEPRKEAYAFHELPQYICWLNFWSTLMLQNIGYNPATHDHLFHYVERLEHGTVFQLTEQPTDPEIPEHLTRLLAVYEAFPKIGGRHLIKDMDFE